jgi:hypothetical protein
MAENDNNKETVRYPHSAELFRFCKEALAIKHNNTVKVIDQHVGAILGFDPADCSHWKRGRKSIRSLQTITAIAKHLSIDARIVSDLVSGRADLSESIQEYKGYGATELSTQFFDELKQSYFRDPLKYAIDGKSPSFDELTVLDVRAIDRKAEDLLDRAAIRSCPVLIPEVLSVLPEVRLQVVANDESPVTLGGQKGSWVIEVQPGCDQKPFGRFLIAKAIGRIVLDPDRPANESNELIEARSNHFASALLMPYPLFAVAMREVDDTRDIVSQLAETFWMTRSTVNLRLKDLMGIMS